MRRERRGAQAVEFALMMPVLLTLLSGVVDAGEYLWLAENLVGAVGAGARQGAVTDPRLADPLVIGRSGASVAWAGSELRGTPVFTSAYSGGSPDRSIGVTGRVAFTPIFGFVPLPAEIRYTSTVRTTVQP